MAKRRIDKNKDPASRAKASRSGSPRSPKRLPFDYSLDYASLNLREQPDLYRVGKGEQGVLLVEPYKSEILPYWKFKTVPEAKASCKKIYRMFLAYLKADDFPGADMARKFLQMGWTRARRYANHKGGRKYDKQTGALLPPHNDEEKAAAAAIFYERYVAARENKKYLALKARHLATYEQG